MKCPYCHKTETKVVDKRETNDDHATRRRRECLSCSKRFTTYERVELINLTIVKKDGTREQFDKSKIEKGIIKAAEKRPVSRDSIQKICDEIEIRLRNRTKTEVPSREIGRMVMNRLKKLDHVAYVRFASVYKEFKDAGEFGAEVESLKGV